MAPRGSSRHRPVFHAVTLVVGFIVGGVLTQVARMFLPASPVKQFFTSGVHPSVGPAEFDLVLIRFTLGPVALDVSLLSLLGVLIAYLIARSLF